MKEGTLSRIKKYLDYKGISNRAFEMQFGFSNGSFASQLKNGKTIGVDRLENILNEYTDINVEWLLTGRGSMLKPPGLMDDAEIAAQDEEVRQGKVSVYQYDPKNAIITAKDESIAAHKKTIASNEVTIGALQARIRDLEAQLHSSSTVLDNAPAVDIPSVGARTQTSAK